jgi:glycosyltransferase involved in cell wall biosynthesis
MSKKFFLISQVFYPDEVSTAGLFTNLCSVIAEDNYEVVVWSAQPSYSKHRHQPRKLVHKRIKIHYLGSTSFDKDKIIGRLTNIISFSISVSLKLLFSRDKSPVFTHTTPPPLGIIVSFICFIKRRSFVYILLDIFPEGLIRLGKVSGANLFIRFWHFMFISSLKKSKKIIVLGRDMMNWLWKVNPKDMSKVEYIPHWQNDNLIFPAGFDDNEFVTKYNLHDKFVLQYSGNMGLWNDMEPFGKAVNMNIKDILYMFVGGGLRKNELLRSFSLSEQKNVLFLPFQPAEKLGSILTACHAGLVSLRNGLEGMAVPCKIYGILAAGVPVIAMVPENSEIAFIVREENCGYVIHPNDLNGLIKAIIELKSNQKLRALMGNNGRRAFEQKYSTKIIADKYKVLIQSLI